MKTSFSWYEITILKKNQRTYYKKKTWHLDTRGIGTL